MTTPQHCPSARELDDVDLLAHGVLADPPRFGGPDVTLTVPLPVAEAAVAAGELELVDPEGLPLARVTVERTGGSGEAVVIEGPVTMLTHPQFGPFRRLHLTPEQVRTALPAETLTVLVDRPLTTADLRRIGDRAAGRPVLLLALTGWATPSYGGRALAAPGLVRASLAAADLLDGARVVAVPLAARGWRREEADAALRRRVAAAYAPGDEVLDVADLTAEGPLPEGVARALRIDAPPPDRRGLVLFFTGLSGSGKSTLARALHDRLLERGDRTVSTLDGDVVRRHLSAGLTFSKADRETNIRRIGWVAAEISRHGGVAICSPIAPFDQTRRQVRAMVDAAGGAFFLVHVATPLDECERRDRKGLYEKARRGEIPEFTGISSPYEEPQDADVRVDTTGRSIEDALRDVLAVLDERGYLPGMSS